MATRLFASKGKSTKKKRWDGRQLEASVKDVLRTAAVSRVIRDLKKGFITESQARQLLFAIKQDFDKEDSS